MGKMKVRIDPQTLKKKSKATYQLKKLNKAPKLVDHNEEKKEKKCQREK